jgi:hypothetical protein
MRETKDCQLGQLRFMTHTSKGDNTPPQKCDERSKVNRESIQVRDLLLEGYVVCD